MIDWGNTPAGSYATLYLPAAKTNDILRLAGRNYRSHNLTRLDAHTLQCETGGITYIPIPPGEGSNYAGMLSVDLPGTVRKGEAYTVGVHQVTDTFRGHANLTHEIVPEASSELYRVVTLYPRQVTGLSWLH